MRLTEPECLDCRWRVDRFTHHNWLLGNQMPGTGPDSACLDRVHDMIHNSQPQFSAFSTQNCDPASWPWHSQPGWGDTQTGKSCRQFHRLVHWLGCTCCCRCTGTSSPGTVWPGEHSGHSADLIKQQFFSLQSTLWWWHNNFCNNKSVEDFIWIMYFQWIKTFWFELLSYLIFEARFPSSDRFWKTIFYVNQYSIWKKILSRKWLFNHKCPICHQNPIKS